jgi:hypothetical protein
VEVFTMRRISLALAATLVLGLPFSAGAIGIDDFSTEQFAALGFGDAGPADDGAAAPEAIGGTREITLERDGVSLGTSSADSSLSDGGLFSLSNGAGVTAVATLVYDGTADGTTNFNGLGGASVIGGGEDTLRVIARSDLDGTVRIQFHSGSATDYLFADIAVTGAGAGDGPFQIFDISLASLQTQGSGADLGNLGAIQAILSGESSVDLQIDSISTFVIPEPTTVALMGLGLTGLAVAGRRRL